MSGIVGIVKSLIKLYQRVCRPFMKPCCRFYPSCSDYALSAFEHFGIVKGSLTAVWRILRCHPWSEGGYDPVIPESPTRSSEKNRAL